MLSQIQQVCRGVMADLPLLLRATAPFFIAALIGQMMTGFHHGHVQEAMFKLLPMLGSVLHLLATLLGWYAAHKVLISGQGIRNMPGRSEGRFIAVSLFNLLALTAVALIVLMPVAVVLGIKYDTLPEEEIVYYSNQIAKLAPLIMIFIFSRLILSAPMLVRNQPHPNAESWRLTKGHVWRLFWLQLACTLPMAVGSLLAWLVQAVMVLPVILLVAGTFLTIMLYARLAEDEYVRLKD